MTHPFQALGPPPYRYLGHSSESYQAVRGDPSCPIQPGGSCDHCGTGIYEIFRFQAADGTKFKVGSTCVEKAGDAQLVRAIAKDVAKHRAEVAHARQDAIIGRAEAALPAAREALATKPHPTPILASQGRTLADWVDWMWTHSGRAGKVKAAKVVLSVA